MRRREFVTLVGSAAAAWPLGARAHQPGQMRRIAILLPATADDAAYQAWVGAFLQGSCRVWAGALAATYGSKLAWPRPMAPKFADMRRNWPRSRPTSFWPRAA